MPDIDIEIDFIRCEIGDSYNDKTKTYIRHNHFPNIDFFSCTACKEGTFSFNDPYSFTTCYGCLENAQCLGGSKIAPNPGFWRYSNSTTKILKCPESSACLYFISLKREFYFYVEVV